jgi:hypothetical protein
MEIIAYGARTMKKIDVQRYSMNEITAKACTRCYNLSCPLNRVPENVRKVFFQNFPEFTEAWNL